MKRLFGIRLKHPTSNQDGQSSIDCGQLWQQFEREAIQKGIPNKVSENIYAVYYDYESDYRGQYSYFIGCEVSEQASKPEHLDELVIPEQTYHIEQAKGVMTGCLTQAWERIWNSTLPRAYGYDYEVYDERSSDWNDAVVDIYLSIKK